MEEIKFELIRLSSKLYDKHLSQKEKAEKSSHIVAESGLLGKSDAYMDAMKLVLELKDRIEKGEIKCSE